MAYSGLKARYVPLDKLIVTEEGLVDDLGSKVDLLYRLYPVEWFALEEDGVKLINLVTRGRLDIINPPSAFIAQSKVMQAVIWELGKYTNYFSLKEQEVIKRYFLPTYLDEKYLKGKPYIVKPALGREGGGVRSYNARGELEVSSSCSDYEGSLIYQEKVELPKLSVDTWSGEYNGRAVVSGFLIGGVYSGIFVRIGPEITGNLAYFAPVVLK
jgi:glutathionylspermidine synthase